MLPTKEISKLLAQRFVAHETGDIAQVMPLYTEDAEYWDTKTGTGVKGKAALSAHFSAFFNRFCLRFAILEEHRLEDQDAAIVLWECAVRRRLDDGSPGDQIVMQRGMNICVFKGEEIRRDESYMDLASLDQLLVSAVNAA